MKNANLNFIFILLNSLFCPKIFSASSPKIFFKKLQILTVEKLELQ